MFRADLHCHTTCSDGTFSPEQLLHLAKEKELSGISITDHDTIEAYCTAPAIAKQLGIKLGSGVEFSSVFQNLSVHILGYDFDLDSPAIVKLCERHRLRRTERNKRILENLSRLGMPIFEQEFPAGKEHTIGRPHIAHLMIKKGYVATMREAFGLYIGDGKPCFDPGVGISSEETIKAIHQGGGKAFIAHPHLLEHARKIKHLLQLPFDGLECYYARFPLERESPGSRLLRKKGG